MNKIQVQISIPDDNADLRLLPGIIIPTGEGLPFVCKARQSEHSRAYVTFGATRQTDGKTSQGGINISRNSLIAGVL